MKRKENEKVNCNQFILALRRSACIFLKPGNQHICACLHCRGQAVEADEIRHSDDCCFQRRVN
jgi:hypothetical protein